MDRPQKYNPALGLQGNIENALWENQYRRNDISNEVNDRATADLDNREAVEQGLTDLYLDGIQAQQDITELQLQILEG